MTRAATLGVLALLGGIIISLIIGAWPGIKTFGFSFLWTQRWAPQFDVPVLGALAPLYGTLLSSSIAEMWLSAQKKRGNLIKIFIYRKGKRRLRKALAMRGWGTSGSGAGILGAMVAFLLLVLCLSHDPVNAKLASNPPPPSGCPAGPATTKPAKFLIGSYVIRDDGCVVYFDANSGVFEPFPSQMVPGIENAVALAGFDGPVKFDSLALDKDGSVYVIPNGCKAIEDYFDCHVIPARQVKGLPPIQKIATNEGSHLALDMQGHVWGWGNNDAGQIGPKIGVAPYKVKAPTIIPLPVPMQQISVTEKASTALDDQGRVWYWGGDPDNKKYFNEKNIPAGKIHQIDSNFRGIEVEGLPPARQIEGRTVLTQDGSVWRWGPSYLGAIGHEFKWVGDKVPYLVVASKSVIRLESDCETLGCVIVLDDGRRFEISLTTPGNGAVTSDKNFEIAKSDQTCLGEVCVSLVPSSWHFPDHFIKSQIKQIWMACVLLSSGQIVCGRHFIR